MFKTQLPPESLRGLVARRVTTGVSHQLDKTPSRPITEVKQQ